MHKRIMLGLMVAVWTIAFSWSVNAEEFCVATATQLEDALDSATANGESDIIRVQRGTYLVAFGFLFSSDEDADIAVLGGYGPGCTERVIDPVNTVLDAAGEGSVFSFTQRGDGDVSVEGLTLQNAGYRGLYIRLYNTSGGNVGSIDIRSNIVADCKSKGGIYIASEPSATSTAGPVRLIGNQIVGNTSDYGGGGLSMQLPWGDLANDVILVNNRIVGNSGSDISGGAFINTGAQTRVYFINNTVADNRTVDTTADVGGVYFGFSSSMLNIYNNIVQGNTSDNGVADIYFYNYAAVRIGYHNSYSEIHGTWTDAVGNGDIDPRFILPGHWDDSGTPGDPTDDVWMDGDYHLGADSACIDAGYSAAPELPFTDFEGDPRIVNGDNDGIAEVDIGADEVFIPCLADVEPDGDVDGADLAAVASGSAVLTPAVIADEFGRANCL